MSHMLSWHNLPGVGFKIAAFCIQFWCSTKPLWMFDAKPLGVNVRVLDSLPVSALWYNSELSAVSTNVSRSEDGWSTPDCMI